ncbi:hypothetical protein [Candidatus Palauibacter sp.]|uniref:hypothetical protein n=1 Tax=Candidatus Palauibacter sp. TaxID=3101350 RepID=UPI003B5CE9C9
MIEAFLGAIGALILNQWFHYAKNVVENRQLIGVTKRLGYPPPDMENFWPWTLLTHLQQLNQWELWRIALRCYREPMHVVWRHGAVVLDADDERVPEAVADWGNMKCNGKVDCDICKGREPEHLLQPLQEEAKR